MAPLAHPQVQPLACRTHECCTMDERALQRSTCDSTAHVTAVAAGRGGSGRQGGDWRHAHLPGMPQPSLCLHPDACQ